jgi:hypothetical protein
MPGSTPALGDLVARRAIDGLPCLDFGRPLIGYPGHGIDHEINDRCATPRARDAQCCQQFVRFHFLGVLQAANNLN